MCDNDTLDNYTVPSGRFFYVSYTVVNRGIPVREEQAVIPQTPMRFLIEFQERSSYGERIGKFNCIAEITEADYYLITQYGPDCIEANPFYVTTPADL